MKTPITRDFIYNFAKEFGPGFNGNDDDAKTKEESEEEKLQKDKETLKISSKRILKRFDKFRKNDKNNKIKKVYRRISLYIHPDKCIENKNVKEGLENYLKIDFNILQPTRTLTDSKKSWLQKAISYEQNHFLLSLYATY